MFVWNEGEGQSGAVLVELRDPFVIGKESQGELKVTASIAWWEDKVIPNQLSG